MSLIILSGLGTGAYREATYQAEGHSETIRTGLFATALKSWYPEAAVKILATDTAWERENGQHVREHHPDFERIAIPDGRTEAEAWEIFQAVADAVPRGATVIFDITHGLRSLPMLGFLVLSYLQVVKEVQIEKVFYGALELTPRQEDALTPVVDLTPLVKLLDWAQAAGRFQDTGDATLFKPLIRERGPANLNNVAEKMTLLSTALATNRTIETAELAQGLIGRLDSWKKEETLAKHTPFLMVADSIRQQVLPLAGSGDSRLQLLAHHAQIEWYLSRGHHVQAIGLAREWLVSVVGWSQSGELELDMEQREKATKLLGKYAKTPAQAPENLREAVALWDKLTTLRNDLLHFGMRKSRTGSGKVADSVQATLAQLPGAVKPLGLELEPPNTPAP